MSKTPTTVKKPIREKTEYKSVWKLTYGNGNVKYKVSYPKYDKGNRSSNSRLFDTAKEGAISFDKFLIEQGKEPVNVLVKK